MSISLVSPDYRRDEEAFTQQVAHITSVVLRELKRHPGSFPMPASDRELGEHLAHQVERVVGPVEPLPRAPRQSKKRRR